MITTKAAGHNGTYFKSTMLLSSNDMLLKGAPPIIQKLNINHKCSDTKQNFITNTNFNIVKTNLKKKHPRLMACISIIKKV
jgi:hypothetical protein